MREKIRNPLIEGKDPGIFHDSPILEARYKDGELLLILEAWGRKKIGVLKLEEVSAEDSFVKELPWRIGSGLEGEISGLEIKRKNNMFEFIFSFQTDRNLPPNFEFEPKATCKSYSFKRFFFYQGWCYHIVDLWHKEKKAKKKELGIIGKKGVDDPSNKQKLRWQIEAGKVVVEKEGFEGRRQQKG